MEKTTLTQYIKNIFYLQNLWGSIVPMQFIGIYALYTIFTGQAPAWWWVATLIGYLCMATLGISIGYHRLFSHRSFKSNPLVRRLILWCGIIAGQGSPIYWIGIHRGYHHRYADKPGDSHSPRDGFWHSYILWMFKMRKISIRSVVDLMRDSDMVFAHKHYQTIFWLSHLAIALISFELWLYLMGFAAFITLHCFLSQTCLTHYRSLGYRNYEVNDNSVNNPWLFPLALGDAWHNNHHGTGRNPNFGGRRWWELDPAYWIISAIRTDK
jgi:stearoyl-CoA desaturase (delta-9 desaturase)